MIKTVFPVTFFLFFCFSFAHAQQTPPSADEIMKEAYALAAKENKKIFLLFHASWCGWCHKMDASMNDKVCKNFFDDNFVIRHLAVFESPGKKNLENPGALQLLTKYNGAEDGIPFWLVFDKEGKLLADSKMRPEGAGAAAKGVNTGCPASKEEVDYFILVLRKTTTLNNEQLAIIEKRFRQNSPGGAY
jgi:thiol-disulfide isomerase/thioredoxin